MATERLVMVQAQSEEDFRSFVDFLKKHFSSVVDTGTTINAREPFKGGVRGYITLIGDAKEAKGRD